MYVIQITDRMKAKARELAAVAVDNVNGGFTPEGRLLRSEYFSNNRRKYDNFYEGFLHDNAFAEVLKREGIRFRFGHKGFNTDIVVGGMRCDVKGSVLKSGFDIKKGYKFFLNPEQFKCSVADWFVFIRSDPGQVNACWYGCIRRKDIDPEPREYSNVQTPVIAVDYDELVKPIEFISALQNT